MIRAHAVLSTACLVVLVACNAAPSATPTPTPVPLRVFSGAAAYAHVRAQVAFGPRPPGSAAVEQTATYLAQTVTDAQWTLEMQTFDFQGVSVRNVIGRANIGHGPVVILGAHYDTRPVADQDPTDRTLPVLGANDGASGAAVLAELMPALDLQYVPYEVWVVFFDAEDSGDLNDWPWSVGARYTAEHLDFTPHAVIVVDMVGDTDQQLFLERNSTPALQSTLWAQAAELGYAEHFINTPKYGMTDDHTPFLQRGFPAVDIIDFDYPQWHTAADTLDQISAESLERVGRTLEAYLEHDLSRPTATPGRSYP